jgi:transposase
MNTRKAYPTDLTDAQWQELAGLLPPRRDRRGAREQHSRRELLNAILYVSRNGIVWEALPHDFPPYKTVYDYFWKLARRGVWQRVVDALRMEVRQQAERDPHPSIVVMDSQAVKTTEKGANEVTMRING